MIDSITFFQHIEEILKVSQNVIFIANVIYGNKYNNPILVYKNKQEKNKNWKVIINNQTNYTLINKKYNKKIYVLYYYKNNEIYNNIKNSGVDVFNSYFIINDNYKCFNYNYKTHKKYLNQNMSKLIKTHNFSKNKLYCENCKSYIEQILYYNINEYDILLKNILL